MRTGLIFRWLTMLLRPPGPAIPLRGATHAQAAMRAWVVVRALYAYNLVVVVLLLRDWQRWVADPQLDALWAVSWVPVIGTARGATVIHVGYLLGSILVLLRPWHRGFRLLCAVSAFEAFALQGSFGKINHGSHGLLWTLLILVLLPSRTGDTPHLVRRFHQRTLRVFWTAQAAILMFYSMSGALKLYASINQVARGQHGFLSLEGAARHIAGRTLQTNGDTLLGALIVAHPWLGVPTQWLTLYLEMLALLVAFRTASHRIWGIGLICMHVGIGLFMNIWFVHQIAAVSLLLVCSPFVREGLQFTDELRALPGVDLLARWRSRPVTRTG